MILQLTKSIVMKTRLIMLGVGALTAVLLQGCVSIPPLIQIEHKESVSNQDLGRRLDAIDHRLDQIEKANAAKAEQKP